MAKHYTTEQLDSIKQISILDYAQTVLGFSFTKESSKKHETYRMTEHDSCFVSVDVNLWNRTSDSSKAAGGDIINFVMYWEDLSFAKAVNKLLEYSSQLEKVEVGKVQPVARNFNTNLEELPARDKNMKNIYAFLIQERKISPDIVREWINQGVLYQGEKYKECVFTGRFKDKILFATKVSTSKNQEGKFSKFDVSGSMKEIGIHFNYSGDTLMVFESPMDCMAYQSLLLKEGRDYKNKNYLVCGGAATAPGTLKFNLGHYGKDIKQVIFSLDNDRAGIEAMKHCQEVVGDRACKIQVTNYKDWNDALKANIQNEAKVKICELGKENAKPTMQIVYYDEKKKERPDIMLCADLEEAVKQIQYCKTLSKKSTDINYSVSLVHGIECNSIALIEQGTCKNELPIKDKFQEKSPTLDQMLSKAENKANIRNQSSYVQERMEKQYVIESGN